MGGDGDGEATSNRKRRSHGPPSSVYASVDCRHACNSLLFYHYCCAHSTAVVGYVYNNSSRQQTETETHQPRQAPKKTTYPDEVPRLWVFRGRGAGGGGLDSASGCWGALCERRCALRSIANRPGASVSCIQATAGECWAK